MAIGWVTDLTDAESYFSTERLETAFWDALTTTSGGKDEKTAVLTMAYNRIRFCKKFTVPSLPDATQAAKLRMAQCEMAYYLAGHLADEDRRKGLHAQGVVGANIVGETYARFESDQVKLTDIPIPGAVIDLLDEFTADETPFYSVDIERDENEAVDYDPTDL